jgi:hypothetical protein
MIINDEPSPIKRLRVETPKMIKSSLHKISSFAIKHMYFVLAGLMLVIAGSFYFVDTVSSQGEKDVADENLQRYNACILSKNLLTEDTIESSLIDVDNDCKKLSHEGKIMESEQDIMAQEIAIILEGTNMEEMAEYIASKDKKVAAMILGIANIESQMGKRAPSKAGIDCYNYWGYKTSGSRGQAMGHACFGSPEEAVDTIAKRLAYFVHETNRDTPAKIVYPWKCGGSCASHSPESVSRWIGVVNKYYSQVIAIEDGNELNQEKSKFLSRK